jgi:hypothetical protein
LAGCVLKCTAPDLDTFVAPFLPQIEAYQSLLRKHKHSNHFALLREIPDSEPPRTTQLMDR